MSLYFPLAHYTELQSKKRPHRSVDRNDRELHNYTYSKMVLIHALGNTGSSRDHLLTYMRPGEGDNSWRRAAILAMRHFGCVEVCFINTLFRINAFKRKKNELIGLSHK